MSRSIWITIVLFLAMTMGLSACGSSSDDAPAAEQSASEESSPAEAVVADGMLPEVNPLEVTGPIVTAGSSTVYPLSEAMAERFCQPCDQG